MDGDSETCFSETHSIESHGDCTELLEGRQRWKLLIVPWDIEFTMTVYAPHAVEAALVECYDTPRVQIPVTGESRFNQVGISVERAPQGVVMPTGHIGVVFEFRTYPRWVRPDSVVGLHQGDVQVT